MNNLWNIMQSILQHINIVSARASFSWKCQKHMWHNMCKLAATLLNISLRRVQISGDLMRHHAALCKPCAVWWASCCHHSSPSTIVAQDWQSTQNHGSRYSATTTECQPPPKRMSASGPSGWHLADTWLTLTFTHFHSTFTLAELGFTPLSLWLN